MNAVWIAAAACLALALPGAALAQRGDGSHEGHGGMHGGEPHGGGPRPGGDFHAQGLRDQGFHEQDFRERGFRGAPAISGGFAGPGARFHFGAGSIGRFGAHDFAAWRGGFWWHGFRGGRVGWWWFTDGFWYWYDAPVYPYPGYVADYYVPGDAYGPNGEVWYYCYNPPGYYPNVHACPTGWRVVPAP